MINCLKFTHIFHPTNPFFLIFLFLLHGYIWIYWILLFLIIIYLYLVVIYVVFVYLIFIIFFENTDHLCFYTFSMIFLLELWGKFGGDICWFLLTGVLDDFIGYFYTCWFGLFR
jgi:hypothetical protein